MKKNEKKKPVPKASNATTVEDNADRWVQVIYNEHSRLAPFSVRIPAHLPITSTEVEQLIQQQTRTQLAPLKLTADATQLNVVVMANAQIQHASEEDAMQHLTVADFVGNRGNFLVEARAPASASLTAEERNPLFFDLLQNNTRLRSLLDKVMVENKLLKQQLRDIAETESVDGVASVPLPETPNPATQTTASTKPAQATDASDTELLVESKAEPLKSKSKRKPKPKDKKKTSTAIENTELVSSSTISPQTSTSLGNTAELLQQIEELKAKHARELHKIRETFCAQLAQLHGSHSEMSSAFAQTLSRARDYFTDARG